MVAHLIGLDNMKAKKKTQVFISLMALTFGLMHLIFPDVKIDGIFITLLIVGVLPWLEPLFKSVELPGGLKIEYQDLKKIEDEAKKAGLIKSKTDSDLNSANPIAKSKTFTFIEIAEKIRSLRW